MWSRSSFTGLLFAAATSVGASGCHPSRISSHSPRERLPDSPLIDQKGRRFSLYDTFESNKPLLISFLYTECDGV